MNLGRVVEQSLGCGRIVSRCVSGRGEEPQVRVGSGGSDELSDGAVNAVLEDRGGASSASATSFTQGFGLRSLSARAEALGGTLDATPTPSGFRLSLALPAPAETSVDARQLPARATAGSETGAAARAAVAGYAT